MGFLDALLLGVIEGITEFLPVSSTGHLILANSLLGIPDSEFVRSFDIVIQLGAISAAGFLYWRSFLDLEIIKRVLLAFIPTGIIGLAMYQIVKTYLLGNSLVVVLALAIGGIVLIVFELLYPHADKSGDTVKDITYRQSMLIGLIQAVSIVPGVSRSAATIVGGLMVSNASRRTIVEFSFLLAVPTMLAATGLDLLKSAGSFAQADFTALAVGFIVSFVVALAAIRFLLSYVRGHSFFVFGVYRIAVAAVFAFYFLG